MIYADIADFFPDSCLIYAFASAEVLVHLPKCYYVNHDIQGGGYMLNIDEMTALVKDRAKKNIDYTSNIYSAEPPEGGVPASRLDVFIAWLNQSAWVYDPLYESWWKYVDTSDPDEPGQLHPEIGMCEDGLGRVVRPGGLAIFAGLIDTQEYGVREALQAQGLTVVDRLQEKDWVGLIAKCEA